jgi:hypothetical protein
MTETSLSCRRHRHVALTGPQCGHSRLPSEPKVPEHLFLASAAEAACRDWFKRLSAVVKSRRPGPRL